MTEMERDYLAAKAGGLELVVLLLRLWVIVFCVFIGLWVLGVILMTGTSLCRSASPSCGGHRRAAQRLATVLRRR